MPYYLCTLLSTFLVQYPIPTCIHKIQSKTPNCDEDNSNGNDCGTGYIYIYTANHLYGQNKIILASFDVICLETTC